MREIIKKLEERIDLDNQIMTDAVNQIMSGEVEDPMIEDFLINLNAKGITESCLLYTSPSPRDLG